MDGHVRFDPSSISLFSSTSAAPVDDQTRSSVPDEERPVSSTSQAAIIQKSMDIDGGGEQGVDDKREVKFSTYHRKKNMEVVYRRNLIDRLDKLKASHEAFFTVPQLKLVSNNQLSLFLRRLLKSADIKQHISTEMLERILLTEELEEKSTDLAKLRRNNDELCQFTDRMSANGKPELQREVTDFEDDEIFGPSDEFTLRTIKL
uniref:BHLH domain-containing protein n=1 Tax=Globodera pallida TaxID=36090 RepID=A0A183C1X0_GLOPA